MASETISENLIPNLKAFFWGSMPPTPLDITEIKIFQGGVAKKNVVNLGIRSSEIVSEAILSFKSLWG